MITLTAIKPRILFDQTHIPFGLCLLILLGAALQPLLPTFNTDMNLARMLESPSAHHPLGTDNLGRDLLSRFYLVLQDSVIPLWIIAFGATTQGILLFLLKKTVDETKLFRNLSPVLDLIAASLSAMPIMLMVFLWSTLRQEADFLSLAIPLGVIITFRSFYQIETLYNSQKPQLFWTAHQALGGTTLRAIWRYGICDAWKSNLAGLFTFHMQMSIVVEVAISYLGFGIQEPKASMGNMLKSHFDLILRGQGSIVLIMTIYLAAIIALPKLTQTLFKI